jgi:uncharacterized membrane protein YeaQ/YmgE (transglycosylase-associated protein family)
MGSLENMILFIIVLLIVGFIVGLIARALVPGRDKIGIGGTILLGIVGSFIGGFIDTFVQYHTLSVHQFHPVGIIWSIVGAVVLLLLLRVTGLEPGRRGRRRLL